MKAPFSRREFIKKSALVTGAAMTAPLLPSCASPGGNKKSVGNNSGPFQPTWESLAKNYRCPDWFRDAKFGIWAHWTAQCVPEQGDWYARQMYIQGHRHYEHHLKTYGHPSQSGFMEIDNLWKAENWQPEELMKRYVRAGAKYFTSCANHHDNFDNYNSKYHAWNSVNVGPRKDIIGTWAKVARKHGLRFGVTNHSGHAWHWFQTAYGYDGEGEMAGVRYDAYRLTKADGKGKWWEGLDPQELYTGPNIVMPDGLTSAKIVRDWHEKNDRPWNENPPPMNPKFTRTWFLRCRDLVDKYHPDLLYFDNIGQLPLGQAGLDMAAYYYNSNYSYHDGKLEAVLNVKGLDDLRRPALVEDYERGFADGIKPQPWQTDTCIGDWHYDRSIFDRHRYKTVGQVVRMLVDIVSKNGNLLLNIPVKGDGTIDADEIKFLDGMAAWMEMNGEGIFGTRPWKIFGEGPTKVQSGMFNENRVRFGAQDVRFTSKCDVLYAYFLGWPEDGQLTIQSLATGAADKSIASLKLLGSPEKVVWTQDAGGLHVTLPATKPGNDVFALKLA
jgi:alpha-L-fucosidase